jgi:hypothetical protein
VIERFASPMIVKQEDVGTIQSAENDRSKLARTEGMAGPF